MGGAEVGRCVGALSAVEAISIRAACYNRHGRVKRGSRALQAPFQYVSDPVQ
jgi:hypothetical protein